MSYSLDDSRVAYQQVEYRRHAGLAGEKIWTPDKQVQVGIKFRRNIEWPKNEPEKVESLYVVSNEAQEKHPEAERAFLKDQNTWTIPQNILDIQPSVPDVDPMLEYDAIVDALYEGVDLFGEAATEEDDLEEFDYADIAALDQAIDAVSYI